MWPDLFGPGWVLGVLTACGLLAACVALVCLLGRAGTPDSNAETFQELWRRYEQGDLTAWEFERLRPASTRFVFVPGASLGRPTVPASQVPQGGRASNHRASGRLLKTAALFIAAVMAAAAVAQAASPLGTPGQAAGAAQRPGYALTRPVIYEPWRGWCMGRLGSCGFQGEAPR